MNKAGQIFTEFLKYCADKTLKLKKRGTSNRKIKNPWYDQNCGSLRKQFTRLANLLQKHRKEPYAIGQGEKLKKS